MFGLVRHAEQSGDATYLNERSIPHDLVASGDEEWAHPKTLSVDDGLAADVSRRGRDLRQLHPGRLSRSQDRRALRRTTSCRDLFRDCRKDFGVHRQHDRRRHRHRGGHVDRCPGRHPQELRRRGAGAQLRAADLGPRHSARRPKLDWHPAVAAARQCGGCRSQTRCGRGTSERRRRDIDLVPQGCRCDATWKEDPAIKAGWRSWINIIRMATRQDSYAMFGYAAAETLVQVLDPVRQRPVARKHHAPGGRR